MLAMNRQAFAFASTRICVLSERDREGVELPLVVELPFAKFAPHAFMQ